MTEFQYVMLAGGMIIGVMVASEGWFRFHRKRMELERQVTKASLELASEKSYYSDMADRLERLIRQVIQNQDRDNALIQHLHRDIIAMFHKMEQLMSKISDFAAAMDAFTARQGTAVAGLQTDVQALKGQITALQNSAGEITPEDQALLDAVQAHAQVIADKLDALDALTPPAVPATP